jgi:hypothetical protein
MIRLVSVLFVLSTAAAMRIPTVTSVKISKTMTVERCLKQGGTIETISNQKWCTTPIKRSTKK